MTTAAEIIARALRPMRDADQVFFVDAELLEYLNEAVVDLSVRQLLFHEEDTSCTVAGGVIPYSAIGGNSDVVRVRWAYNPDGLPVSWVQPEVFKGYQIAYPTQPAEVPFAAVWDETIHIHPIPDNGEVWTVGYYAIPALLDSDADTFPLARQWEEKVVRFVRAECYYRLGEGGLGDRDKRAYEEGLRPNDRVYDRNAPGKLTLAREGNIFDMDTESIHQG